MLESEPVASLLERLADGSPTPGGGAAAALTAATAAALLGMVSRVVARRSTAAAAPAEVDDLRRRALALVTEDARAYRGVVEARQVASGRAAALERALLEAAEPPLEVARLGGAILQRCAALVGSASGAVRSDLDVAATLARAALDAACLTARANARDLHDRAAAGRLESELSRLTADAEAPRALAREDQR